MYWSGINSVLIIAGVVQITIASASVCGWKLNDQFSIRSAIRHVHVPLLFNTKQVVSSLLNEIFLTMGKNERGGRGKYGLAAGVFLQTKNEFFPGGATFKRGRNCVKLFAAHG